MSEPSSGVLCRGGWGKQRSLIEKITKSLADAHAEYELWSLLFASSESGAYLIEAALLLRLILPFTRSLGSWKILLQSGAA
jgi:hypothetical protein